MRRRTRLAVAALVTAALVGHAAPALASSSAGDRPQAYCVAIERAFGLSSPLSPTTVATELPTDAREVLGEPAKAFRRAARLAPEGIRSAVKRIARSFTKLAKLDPADLADAQAALQDAYGRVLLDTATRCLGTPSLPFPTTTRPLR